MDTSKPSKSTVNGERDLMLTPARSANGAVPPNGTLVRPRAATRTANDNAGFSLVAILASLRRKWPVALVLGLLLGPALAAAGWFALAPKHSATAYLRLNLDNSPLAFKTADQGAGGIVAFKVYKNTQKQLVLSPLVLNSALEDLAKEESGAPLSVREADDPLQWLSKELKVTFPDDGEVMAIELSSKSTKDSMKIVDAVVSAYKREAVDSERISKTNRLEFLDKARSAAVEKVRSKRSEIQILAEPMGTGDSETLSLVQQTALQQFGQLQTELNKLTYDLLEAEGKLESTRQQLTQMDEAAKKREEENKLKGTATEVELGFEISQLEFEQALAKDLEYQQLSAEGREITKKIREMERASLGARMTGPLLAEAQQVKKALADRREVVTEMVEKDMEMRMSSGRLKASETGGISENIINPQLETKQALDVEILKKRRDRVEADLKRVEEQANKIGKSTISLEMKRSELESLEEVVSRLSNEYEATSIELNSISRVSVISDATPVESADLKKRLAATLAGGVFGLALPLLAFTFFDMQKKHLDDPMKLRHELNVDLLGMVPSSKGPIATLDAKDNRRGRQQYANLVESVNSIVAMLVKKASIDERQIFMVTSAAPSEGKSTLAQNLWSGLCDANYRCLLIDMDFRRPSIHRYLDVEIGLGASEVLSGKTTVGEAIRTVDTNRHYMTAGESRQLNLASLASDPLPKLFDYLRAQYDFIIVDTAPILPVVDSRIIGEHVDGAVLATIRDRSRLPQLIAAIELLKAHDTDILGVVVSGFGSANYGYSYYRS